MIVVSYPHSVYLYSCTHSYCDRFSWYFPRKKSDFFL
jgi:hypothetical protein